MYDIKALMQKINLSTQNHKFVRCSCNDGDVKLQFNRLND